MINSIIEIAKIATDFDAAGKYDKADRLDRLLKSMAGEWRSPSGDLHADELEGFDEETVKPNLSEEMEASQLRERSPKDVGLGSDSEDTYSSILHDHEDLFKRMIVKNPGNAEQALMDLFNEMAKRGHGKVKQDPEFAPALRKLISETLKNSDLENAAGRHAYQGQFQEA